VFLLRLAKDDSGAIYKAVLQIPVTASNKPATTERSLSQEDKYVKHTKNKLLATNKLKQNSL
jgi:hypothetical protein